MSSFNAFSWFFNLACDKIISKENSVADGLNVYLGLCLSAHGLLVLYQEGLTVGIGWGFGWG